jgi:hypothetical protein
VLEEEEDDEEEELDGGVVGGTDEERLARAPESSFSRSEPKTEQKFFRIS